MKFIASRIYLLERENIAAQQELADMRIALASIRKERDHFEALYRTCWKKHSSLHRGNAAKQTPVNAYANSLKSYMRPTTASVSRAISAHKEGERIVSKCSRLESSAAFAGRCYVDGQLVPTVKVTLKTNYMFNTRASAARSGDWHHTEIIGCWSEEARSTGTTPGSDRHSQDSWSNDSSTYTSMDVPEWGAKEAVCHVPSRDCLKCDWLNTCNASDANDSLRVLSRLDDDQFYHTTPSTCFVPFSVQISSLESALLTAQEVLWHALRTHWPDFQRSRYLESPREVRFGFTELQDAGFGDRTFPAIQNGMCGRPPSDVLNAILGVIDLRNANCHPEAFRPSKVDALVRKAQNLAVMLQDEARALKLRGIRDRFQTEVSKSYVEITESVGFASLTGTYPWAVHHERFFETVRDDIAFGDSDVWKYDVVIHMAVSDWRSRGIAPGESDPSYIASMKEARAYSTV